MSQSKLEQLAIIQRNTLVAANTYDSGGDNYSATHTRALSDNLTPVAGKGTGVYLDTVNGGGSHDIYGNPAYAGSGRLAQLSANPYNGSTPYTAPDTTANVGQVVL